MSNIAREYRLKRRPEGVPAPDDFEFVERALPILLEDQVLVRNHWMSVDPYMRGRMENRVSYIPPFQLGEPMEGSAVGIVEASTSPDFAEGQAVSHFAGWRDRVVLNARELTKIDDRSVPIQAYLGPLGIPGLTAHVGLTKIGRIKANETVFVSAGGGAVGSVAVQMARLRGARVVASAGSPEKIRWLKEEAGVDVAINYREVASFTDALSEACPDGLDLYFDNVGGEQLDAALVVANDHARFALCGMIGQYNSTLPPAGPRHIYQAVVKRLALQGFIITDHLDSFPEFISEMVPRIVSGEIRWKQTIAKGIEAAPAAFIGLFKGENVGKMLVDLRP